MEFDVAIIGGGPGGYTAADEAARRGLSTVLFEAGKLGGTCLNRGCIPTKAMLHDAEAGISDLSTLRERRDGVVDALRTGIAKLMKTRKVTIVEGFAQIIAPNSISCNGETYEARDIIVATGSIPSIPPIPGADLPGVYTSNDLLEGDSPLPASIIIVGGGVIGMELALFFALAGSEVHVLEAMERILPPMDREIAQRVAMHAKKRGIAIEASAKVEKIEGEPGAMRVRYRNKKGDSCELAAEGVLIATGRRANTAGLFGEGHKPELERGAIVSDSSGRSSIPGIWVIGDARAGTIQLAHMAEAQARNVVAAISGKEPPVDEKTVPSCVYLSPEVASVGLTEDEAKAAGIEVVCGKALTGANGKCLIEESESGYIKLVCDAATHAVLGAQLVCPRATDMVAELALAINLGATAEQLAATIHPHPTISEMIGEAARAVCER